MKGYITLMLLLLPALLSSAQCKYTWEAAPESGITCYQQQTKSSAEIFANCNIAFTRQFLDSIVNDVMNNPVAYPRGKDSPGVVSDFRLYKYDTLEIVHYRTEKYLFDGDTLVFHDLSFSPWRQWNVDGCYHFLYNSNWGILCRWLFEMNPTEYSFIKSNSCLTEERSRKLNDVISTIKRSSQ